MRPLAAIELWLALCGCGGQGASPTPPSAAAKNTTLSRLGKRGLAQLDEGPEPLFGPDYLRDMYRSGLRRMTANTKTDECRRKIEIEYMRQLRVVAEESPYPFEDVYFHTQCPTVWDELSAETQHPLLPVLVREPPRGPDTRRRFPAPPERQADWRSLSICYVMLVHDYPDFAIRIINAINEPQHSFVIHIDRKAQQATVDKLTAYASSVELRNVWLIDDALRQSINWGGFSMVNATLIGMRFAWDVLYARQHRAFDYLIDISGTSYPIKSNEEIRKALASGKPGAVYMDVQTEANRPMPEMWQMYVECDDRLHRVARMPLARGMNMHIGSQWFALPRHVVEWFLHDPLPRAYVDYAKYIVVADENYFATLFKNSPYCQEHDSKNLLFVLFDKWENERSPNNTDARDLRKCLHPDPEHCGRSPTTLTTEYRRLLQVSRFMFARKFDPNQEESMRLVDDLDRWRAPGGLSSLSAKKALAAGDEGKNVMLRYRPSPALLAQEQAARDEALLLAVEAEAAEACVAGSVCPEPGAAAAAAAAAVAASAAAAAAAAAQEPRSDVCLEMGKPGDPIRLRECDSNKLEQWLTIGPCTEGSNVTISAEGGHCAAAVEGQEDMFCMLQGWKSERNLCLDISGESAEGGSPLISWECSGQWNQLFRFHSDCSLSAVQPEFIGKVRGAEGRNVTLCVERARLASPEDGEESFDGAPLNAEVCGGAAPGAGGGVGAGAAGSAGAGPGATTTQHFFEALSEDGPEQLRYRWRRPEAVD